MQEGHLNTRKRFLGISLNIVETWTSGKFHQSHFTSISLPGQATTITTYIGKSCVHSLRWEDVNFDQRTVTLWTRKRKDGNWEPRHIPMNETLYGTLRPMWNRREQQEWVFYNKKEGTRYNRRPKMMKSICKRAGVKHHGFHAIRHFTATYLHDAGKVPTGVIGGLLGHKEKRTTEIYLHSVEESAREAMRKLNEMLALDACTLDRK